MKRLGIVFLLLGVLFLVGHWIFSGNTYFIDEASVLHTSFPIGASFLFGAGVALLLVDWNLRRQRNRPPHKDVEGRPGTQDRIK